MVLVCVSYGRCSVTMCYQPIPGHPHYYPHVSLPRSKSPEAGPCLVDAFKKMQRLVPWTGRYKDI